MDTQPSTPSPSDVLDWSRFRAWLAEQPDGAKANMCLPTSCWIARFARTHGWPEARFGLTMYRARPADVPEPLPDHFWHFIDRLMDRGPDRWTARDAREVATAISQEMQL